jgi:hypothetical protein
MPVPCPSTEEQHKFADHGDLSEDSLRRIATEHGIDFATTLLFEHLWRTPALRDFQQRLDVLPDNDVVPTSARVVIVPGAFYREFPHTGSDGRLIREEATRLGFDVTIVPLVSFGALQTNARILIDFLNDQPADPLVLVSLSKGGSDVKIALSLPGGQAAFRHVTHWISLSGLVNGTPLVQWLFSNRLRVLWFRLLFWWQGYDFSVLPELARAGGAPLDIALDLPPHLRAVHVIGFPLREHLTNALARRCHRRLEAYGPNDGAGILLADALRLPGFVYPVWGADHYLRPGGQDLRPLARKLLLHVRDELREAVPASLSPLSPLGRGAGGEGPFDSSPQSLCPAPIEGSS